MENSSRFKPVIDKIKTINAESAVSDKFLETTLSRLESFGYEIKESDSVMLAHYISATEHFVQKICHITEIPIQIAELFTDKVCGEFLAAQMRLGLLDDVFEFETAISSIQEGDTNVSFSDSVSPKERFEDFITYLCRLKESDIVCYRRLTW